MLRMRVDQVMIVVPGDGQHRLAVELGIVESVEQVNAPRPGRCQANAKLARVFGIGASHECRRLFVAHLDKTDTLSALAQRFHNAVNAVAGKTENHFDPPIVNSIQ